MTISPNNTSAWCLDVRNGPGAFWALCEYFAEGATASFEGDLGRFDLLCLPGASRVETSALRRQTRSPLLDFVVVPVTAENLETIKQRLQAPRTFGRAGDLVHLQLAKGDRLVFGAYDNFHRDCVKAFDLVPQELLDGLVARGVLRGYQLTASAR